MPINSFPALPAYRPEDNWLHVPTQPESRPATDQRSAERIINVNPAVKDLLRRRNSYVTTDLLKRQLGDWTAANPDPRQRADAAYNLARVINFLDNVNDRKAGNSESRDGRINGFIKAGYGTRKNSEARLLVQFAHRGYEALQNLGR